MLILDIGFKISYHNICSINYDPYAKVYYSLKQRLCRLGLVRLLFKIFSDHIKKCSSLVLQIFGTRGDCKRPCFDQLHAHILERKQNSMRFKMCAFSWSKHGHSQSPLASKYLKSIGKVNKNFFYTYIQHTNAIL